MNNTKTKIQLEMEEMKKKLEEEMKAKMRMEERRQVERPSFITGLKPSEKDPKKTSLSNDFGF